MDAVYMSDSELPPGFDQLIPLPKVAFWFQQNLATKTMISLDMSNVVEVDMTGSQTATIDYTSAGAWQQPTGSSVQVIKKKKAVDYTRVKPASK